MTARGVQVRASRPPPSNFVVNLQRVSGVVSESVSASRFALIFFTMHSIAFFSFVQACQGKDQGRETGPQNCFRRNPDR